MKDDLGSQAQVELASAGAGVVRATLAGAVDGQTGQGVHRVLLRPLRTAGVRVVELVAAPDLRVDRDGVRWLLAVSERYAAAEGSVQVAGGTSDLAMAVQDALLAGATRPAPEDPDLGMSATA